MESGTPEENEAIRKLALERLAVPASAAKDATSLSLLLASAGIKL